MGVHQGTDDFALSVPTGSGGPPSGAAGGDLSGTYPNPSIAAAVLATLETAGAAAAAVSAHEAAADPHTGYRKESDKVELNNSAHVDATTKLPEAQGGTNQSTYTKGDMLYATLADTLGKLAVGSDGQVVQASAGLPVWAFGSPTVAVKTSDQTIATATLTNVTSLSFAVTSGAYYHFKFVLLVQSNTATVGIRASVTIPGVTRFGALAYTIIAADGTAAIYSGAITASADAVIPTAVPAINTDYVMIVEGSILPSANGTLQLQAGTETGTTNVIVRQASYGFLTRMA